MAANEQQLSPEALAIIAAEEHLACRAEAAERLKNQLSIADQIMKALMLANGGALIALFTFIGNLAAQRVKATSAFDTTYLWIAFTCFVVGLVAALLTHVCGFLSQERFYMQAMHEAWRNQRAAQLRIATERTEQELAFFGQGEAFYLLGIGLAVASAVAFAGGAGCALSGVLIS